MRTEAFLRTPIRADHQGRMLSLGLSESPLVGNPLPADTYPQTVEISFTIATGTSEVQIAPLWAGGLGFLPDASDGNPTVPADVTEANYSSWSVEGDLILHTFFGLNSAFSSHIALVSPAPNAVRYSKVRLTREFLFTTLKSQPRVRFVFGGVVTTQDDPLWHEKLIIKFLEGKARMTCLANTNDPAQDSALLPMPSVKLAAPGVTTTLRVQISTRATEALDPNWFANAGEYDDVSGEVLAHSVFTLEDQFYNPAHPSHSTIPAKALFQAAATAAYAPDHGAGLPLRASLTGAFPDGKVYRRLNVLRPPIPGSPVSSTPTRPFPTYQLCWSPTAGGDTESLRVSLNGSVYLPLMDSDYDFWCIPRSADPTVLTFGDQMKLSLKSAAFKYISLPEERQTVAIADSSVTLYAHLHEYDSRYVWEAFREIRATRRTLKDKAKAYWNVSVFDWYLNSADMYKEFRAIYGDIRECAGRHGLAPEFLHSVYFGEGGNEAFSSEFRSHVPYDPGKVIDAWSFLGLDLILYRLGKATVSIPPEVPLGDRPADVAERAEFTYNLVTEGYIHPSFAALVEFDRKGPRNEGGFTRTIEVGRVIGWRTTIELVAAEIHARLDEMVNYLAGKVPAAILTEEVQRRYVAYVRFNVRPTTAQAHADDVVNRARRWTGPAFLDTDDSDPRMNALRRVSTASWFEDAGVYR